MEVSNITLVAYMDTLKEYHLDPRVLIEGTSLKYEEILNTKEKVTWREFEIMTNNVFNSLGETKVLESLEDTGINNNALSILKRIGSATFRIEDSYRFFCSFVGRYFYKNLRFHYKKVNKGHIQISVIMNDGSVCFPNFIKAYAAAFQGFPGGIGLRMAETEIDFTSKDPVINIYFTDSIKIWSPISLIKRFFRSLQNTSVLINDIEKKNDDLARLNKRLDNSNQLNETLIKAIMHDLNNPLTIISLKNEKLNHSPEGFSENDKVVLGRAIKNMHSVIDDLKRFFNEKNFSSYEEFNLLEALKETLEIFKITLDAKKLSIVVSSTIPEETTLSGSRATFINSILANILSNAIKFSFEGGVISIGLAQENQKFFISIRDNGVGTERSAIDHFNKGEPCYSLRGTLGETGQGIGLTQATYFTKKMHGEILVTSKLQSESPKDHGTEFKLIFSKELQD